METIPSLTPENSSSSETKRCVHRSGGRAFSFVVLALLFGFIGGVSSPVVLEFMRQKLLFFPQAIPKMLEAEKVRVVAEDRVVADLVEKNSTGVVSIVITKDVPKARSFFGNPFFGFPFFAPEDQNQSEGNKQQIGSGSGFFVSADGLIVTNKHVVSDEDAEYTVIYGEEKKEYSATVLARDPMNDIALLKITGENFPALNLGDSDSIRVGESAIAIGNPLGEFANSVSKGIISGLRRNVAASSGYGETERLSGIIQTDAAINPGNSGGPLFNLSGEVIGVNVAMAQGAENIGFALPINSVKRAIEQVKMSGKISSPYIGVRYVMLNDDIIKANNLSVDHGALVLRGQRMTDFAVIPGSPADKAGLMENDIVLEINGAKLTEENPLANEIAKYTVGDEITLKVWHKGDTKDIKLKLEERK